MNVNIGIVLWFVSGLVIWLMVVVNVLQGGLFDYVAALMLVSPFLFIGFIRSRKWWHMLPFLLIPLARVVVPVGGLRAITPLVFFLFALGFTSLLDLAISKGQKSLHYLSLPGKLLLFYAVIVTGRFLYDRPGFIGLGAEQGGILTAIQYVLAGWAYFFVEPIVRKSQFTRSQLWAVVVAAIIGIMLTAVDAALLQRGRIWYQELAGAPAWVLCAALLPLIMESQDRRLKGLLLPAMTVFVILGVVTRHRTRILFLGGQTLLTAWLGRRFIRVFIFFVITGVLVGAMLFAVGGGRLPGFVLRSLSLFLPADMLYRYDAQPGIYGWQDSFRMELYRTAWMNIKMNPLFGRGVAVDVSDAIAILSGSKVGFLEALMAISAGYHNTFLNMAVGTGLPSALFYLATNIVVLVHFVPWARRCQVPGYREWGFAILSYWYANMMMIMINGGHAEAVHCTVALAYMVGLMRNSHVRAEMEKSNVAKSPEAGSSQDRFQKPSLHPLRPVPMGGTDGWRIQRDRVRFQ